MVDDPSGERWAPIPSATVVLLRDGPHGLETLMLRRSPTLAYAGGAWVWPGGRVDPADHVDERNRPPAPGARASASPPSTSGPTPSASSEAARRAACREAGEELGVSLEPSQLTPFALWTAPPGGVRRFETHLFAAPAPDGPVAVDGLEAVDHRWVRPADMLEDHRAGLVELLPPTWVTLDRLRGFPGTASALTALGAGTVERFAGELRDVADGRVVLFDPDASYGGGPLDLPGARHRFWLLPSGYRYERSG